MRFSCPAMCPRLCRPMGGSPNGPASESAGCRLHPSPQRVSVQSGAARQSTARAPGSPDEPPPRHAVDRPWASEGGRIERGSDSAHVPGRGRGRGGHRQGHGHAELRTLNRRTPNRTVNTNPEPRTRNRERQASPDRSHRRARTAAAGWIEPDSDYLLLPAPAASSMSSPDVCRLHAGAACNDALTPVGSDESIAA